MNAGGFIFLSCDIAFDVEMIASRKMEIVTLKKIFKPERDFFIDPPKLQLLIRVMKLLE